MKKITFLSLFLISIWGFSQDNFPGNTLDFDGGSSEDYVYVPYDASLNPSSFTVMFWAKVDGDQGMQRSVITSRTTTTGYMFYATSSDRWEFWLRTGSTTSKKILGPSVELNKWTFVAGTYSSATQMMKMYVNGELVGQQMGVSYAPNTSKRTRIGAGKTESSTADYHFKGKIDELVLFDAALSEQTIREYQHLTHPNSTPHLVSYWQFNEESGADLPDMKGSNDGELKNMEESDWVSSSIPAGGGTSDTQTEAAGLVSFAGTGLSMDYNSQDGASVTVTHIDIAPNQIPEPSQVMSSDEYWVVNRYGSGSYEADMCFTLNDLESKYETNPSLIRLYHRSMISSGSWTQIATASSADATSHTATFTNISDTGQFFVGLAYLPQILKSIDFTQFELLSDQFNSILAEYSASPCFVDLDGDQLLDLIIGKFNGELEHYEQDSENSTSFTLVTNHFNSIDVGSFAVPTFTDLDGDDLLDMIVGETDGGLSYYEQDNPNSTSFSLVTAAFNGIDVGNYATPTFTDLDGDQLLDLIIGNYNGELVHYEQDSENSTSFTLVTNHFNSIDLGNRTASTFTDLDGDGLLDMIVGESNGILYHYEQNSENATSFTNIINFFSSIDVGYKSKPSFTDLDKDGLLDMIVGNDSGVLYHFEQEEIDTLKSYATLGYSKTKSYMINANHLVGNLSLQSDLGDFTISLSENSGFGQSIDITPIEGKIQDTLFVRFTPTALGTFNAKIRHTSVSMDTSYLNLVGISSSIDNYPGNALDFDGYDDNISVDQISEISGDNARSIELWAYAESFNDGGVFQTGSNVSNKDFSLRTTDTDNLWRMQFYDNDVDVVLPESKGNWHHYCMTYNGIRAKLYYDGELMKSELISLNTSNKDIYFGKWATDYFDGKIDEVRIWNIALNRVQIRENMHISLTGHENGLIAYWQFNENTGNIIHDFTSGRNGLLSGMTNSDWVTSTIPFGGGKSDSHTESNGNITFANTGLNINYSSHNWAMVTVSRIDTLPNINPDSENSTFQNQYWVLNRYGSGGFLADMTFTIEEELTKWDLNHPDKIKLFNRDNTSDTDWTEVAVAGSVDTTNNAVTFNAISNVGQFILAKDVGIFLEMAQSSYDFANTPVGDSSIFSLNIQNTGTDTLFITNILSSNADFSVNMTNLSILAGEDMDIEIKFKPQSLQVHVDSLCFYSNDSDESQKYFYLYGNGTEIDQYAGKHLEFDGTNSYINCGSDAQVTGNQARTIEAWAYTSDFNNGGIFQAGITGTNNKDFSLRTRTQTDQWRMQFWGNDYDVTLPNSINEWHHYCLTYDGVAAKLYYDGNLKATYTVALNTPSHVIWIGRWENSYFQGKIDEVRVWDYALDSVEIRESMHIPLRGNENGLLANWQMNEGSGTTTHNAVGGVVANLINAGTGIWQDSPIPFGYGESNTQTEINGYLTFGTTNLNMDYLSQNGAEVCVNRIDTLPNLLPDNVDTIFQQQYWVVNRYGSGTFSANLHFVTKEDLSPEDQNIPSRIKLFHRESNATGDWEILASADSVNAAQNLVIFNGISDFSQFIIGKVSSPRISVSENTLDFEYINIGDSATMNFTITNTGGDTLFVNLTNNLSVFTLLTPLINTILPMENVDVQVRFKPLQEIDYTDILNIASNAINNPDIDVDLVGIGVRSHYEALAYPFQYELITNNFASVDFGQYSRPCFEDIDGDGLMDILLGDESGKIVHYEEQTAGASDYTLITTEFSGVNVGSFSMPALTDIDGDGLLDLIVGKYNGRLSRYEQATANSYTFNYVTNYFNSIDVGARSCPAFEDLDGDGLLDMIVGEYEGNLNTYRQSATNSTTFNFYSCPLNAIDVGYRSTPFLIDLDGNGKLEMIIGESNGHLNHYEQKSSNPYDFFRRSSKINLIDVGDRSTPFIFDLDGDNLYDILVGEENGHLFHYEQVSTDSIYFGNQDVDYRKVKKYYLRATNITEDLKLHCSGTNYKISKWSGFGFDQELTLTPSNNHISRTIYVRFEPDAEIQYLDSIRQTIAGLDTTYIVLNGSGVRIDPFPGKTLDFDGGEYVNCGTGPLLSSTHSGTLEVWAKVEQFDGAGLFTGINSDGLDFSVKTSNTDNVWRIQFLELYQEVTLPNSLNQWHHYAFTYDGTNARLYYDGELMSTFEVDLNSGEYDLWLARWRTHYLKGKTDELRIWEKCLDQYEIMEKMHLVLEGNEDFLRNYYQFNEDSGDVLPDLVGENNATLINMEDSDWVTSSIPFGDGRNEIGDEVDEWIMFNNVDLNVYYYSQSGAMVSATRIDTVPNIIPSEADTVYTNKYWSVHRYGNGSFDADLVFSLDGQITEEDENNPRQFKLYSRGSSSDTAWTVVAEADYVDPSTQKAYFIDIHEYGQFVIGKVNSVLIEITAFLEGATDGSEMTTILNENDLLPLSQPFNTPPWNYQGTESATNIDEDIVDWVLVELRDTTDVSLATPQTAVAQQALFINKDGDLVYADGYGDIFFDGVKVKNNLYLVIWHRNHLGIISAVPLTETDGYYMYDFSTGVSQAYQSAQNMFGGKAVMIVGDLNNDGTIDNGDHLIWKTNVGKTGYYKEDIDFNLQVDNNDKNEILIPNMGSNSSIPE